MVITPEEGPSNRMRIVDSNGRRERSVFIEDKLKMTVLYFLCLVLMSNEKDGTNIDEKCLTIVDDLESCRVFPWGRCSFNYVLAHVDKLDLLKKSSNVFDKEEGMQRWGCPRFILPLMLLPFECIPALSPEFAQRRDDITGLVPRLCRWSTKYKKKQAPKLEHIMQVLGDTKEIKSILVPTTEERSCKHGTCMALLLMWNPPTPLLTNE